MKPSVALPATALLIHRAYSRKSLTPLGLFSAALTALIHALHPSPVPFVLLVVFYLAGTRATKVKHVVKKSLTVSATGSEGSEGPRTYIQVLANSIIASFLVLVHVTFIGGSGYGYGHSDDNSGGCFSPSSRTGSDLVMLGIVSNYAAVAADTLSSELGILSSSSPRLITSLSLRTVPRGTNGGVTPAGILAGLGGGFIIAATSGIFLRFCPEGEYNIRDRTVWTICMAIWGGLGSILDSVLGGLLQASVVDKRSGKVVEGTGGMKVLVHPGSTKPGSTAVIGDATSAEGRAQVRNTETVANTATLRGSRATGESKGDQPGRHEPGHESRRVESGRDILDNNAVNVLMAGIMSFSAMGLVAMQTN